MSERRFHSTAHFRMNMDEVIMKKNTPICPVCDQAVGSRPLWLVGKYRHDVCYSCFVVLTDLGTDPDDFFTVRDMFDDMTNNEWSAFNLCLKANGHSWGDEILNAAARLFPFKHQAARS